jgi:bacterioferritin
MGNEEASSELLSLLNKAIGRELQVTIQYMFQHSVASSQGFDVSGKTLYARQNKFVASNSIWLPGSSLKKIAIAEMRHAEAITERVVLIGGEPTTQPDAVNIGETAKEMLENDREQERAAIRLYRQIIDVAEKENDGVTKNLFRKILSDEEKHHRTFSSLLGED